MPQRLSIKAISFFPLFLFLLNLLLESLYLTSQDIGHDEPFSIYHAQFDVMTLIGQLKAYNNPPLFELLLHFWIKLFGISPLAVRSLPLVFAALSPLALFYFGKRHFSAEIGIGSSLLLSASSLLLYYSHDCRVYSLFLLLSLLSMHFFLALLGETRTKLTLLWFILATVLLTYAHYFGMFILLFQGLHLLLFYRQQAFRFIAYYLAVLFCYVPQLYVLWQRMGYSVKNGTWLAPPEGAESLYNMLWSFSNFPFITVACIVTLVLALLLALKNRKQLQLNKNLCLVLLWFLFPFFGMFFISFWVPMYIPRYLIFALPAYYLLLCVCLQQLITHPGLQKALIALLIMGFGARLELNPDKKQKIAEAIPLIHRLQSPKTVIAVFPKDYLPTFTYHYNINYFSAIKDGREYHLTDSLLKSENIYLMDGPEDLKAIDASYATIICVTSDSHYEYIPKGLEKERRLYYSRKFTDNLRLCVFR